MERPQWTPRGRRSIDGIPTEKVQTANPSAAKLYSLKKKEEEKIVFMFHKAMIM